MGGRLPLNDAGGVERLHEGGRWAAVVLVPPTLLQVWQRILAHLRRLRRARLDEVLSIGLRSLQIRRRLERCLTGLHQLAPPDQRAGVQRCLDIVRVVTPGLDRRGIGLSR